MGGLTTGSVLHGRYRLQKPLGSGGSATVYAAADERLGREVAVKVWSGAEGLPAPDDETRVLATLSHPGVVVVHDSGVEDGTPFLVMERVPGSSLADVLRAGPVDAARCAALLAQLSRTLADLHAQGLVHGDVTPPNVLVTEGDQVKLADFGEVRRTGGRAESGTPGFVSPEVLAGEPLTAASDVYAVGVLLRRCLARLPEPPEELAALAARCTDGHPERRPGAALLAARLEAYGGHDRTLPLVLPGPRHRRRRRLPLVAAGLLLLGGLAVALPGLGSNGDRPAVQPRPSVTPAAAVPHPTVAPVRSARPAPVAPKPPATHHGKHHGKGRH